mmetsp:Transcript_91260/g.178671  ORF Transcript_91260/g.178671 Transcript_91260/m.178671 type:complete len:250 (-) Transcript_91260:131-880(-)
MRDRSSSSLPAAAPKSAVAVGGADLASALKAETSACKFSTARRRGSRHAAAVRGAPPSGTRSSNAPAKSLERSSAARAPSSNWHRRFSTSWRHSNTSAEAAAAEAACCCTSANSNTRFSINSRHSVVSPPAAGAAAARCWTSSSAMRFSITSRHAAASPAAAAASKSWPLAHTKRPRPRPTLGRKRCCCCLPPMPAWSGARSKASSPWAQRSERRLLVPSGRRRAASARSARAMAGLVTKSAPATPPGR